MSKLLKSRLKEKYENKIIPLLMEKYRIKNRLACPWIEKVVLNMGVGEGAQNEKLIDLAIADLETITGQKPIRRLAKKAISGFKIRKGQPVGVKVTLRGRRMEDFLDKLLNIVLPRVRDFKGLELSSFDKQGNYTLGLREQIIFPEIDYAKVDKIRPLEITIVTNTKNVKAAEDLLKYLGMPFKEKVKSEGKN